MRSPSRIQQLLGVLFVLVPSLLVATPTAARAQDPVTTIATVSESLVVVHMSWSGTVSVADAKGVVRTGRLGSSSICTGWFVRQDGYVVTAGHCVDESRAKHDMIQDFARMLLTPDGVPTKETLNYDGGFVSDMQLAVSVEQVGTHKRKLIESPVNAQVVKYQETDRGDVALIHVPFVTDAPVLPVAQSTPVPGTAVQAIGYPGSLQTREFEREQLTPQASNGQVASLQNYKGNQIIGVTAPIFGGMSGGPVVNSNGEVIGLSSFTLEGLYFATDTKGLRDFLRGLGIEPASAAPAVQPPQETGSHLEHTIVIVALVILLIAAVIYILLLRLRVRKLRATPTGTLPGQATLPAGIGAASS